MSEMSFCCAFEKRCALFFLFLFFSFFLYLSSNSPTPPSLAVRHPTHTHKKKREKRESERRSLVFSPGESRCKKLKCFGGDERPCFPLDPFFRSSKKKMESFRRLSFRRLSVIFVSPFFSKSDSAA